MSIEPVVSPLQSFSRRVRSALYPAGTRRWLAALALASMTLGACASSKNCIDMACGEPSVEIRFEPAITAAGNYRLQLVADGAPSSCAFDFVPNGGRSGASGCGSLLLRGGASRDLATEIVGYALPQSANVSITIHRDGQLLATHTFEPQYSGVELRGEGCSECIVATEVVALP